MNGCGEPFLLALGWLFGSITWFAIYLVVQDEHRQALARAANAIIEDYTKLNEGLPQ